MHTRISIGMFYQWGDTGFSLPMGEMLISDSVLALNQLLDSIDRSPSAITKTNTLKQSIVTAVRSKDILGV